MAQSWARASASAVLALYISGITDPKGIGKRIFSRSCSTSTEGIAIKRKRVWTKFQITGKIRY